VQHKLVAVFVETVKVCDLFRRVPKFIITTIIWPHTAQASQWATRVGNIRNNNISLARTKLS
jgi:hypothetical protein